MSDLNLKFWPIEKVEEDKTELLELKLIEEGVLGSKIKFWGGEGFDAGDKVDTYIPGYSEVRKHREFFLEVKKVSCVFTYDEGEEVDLERLNMIEIRDTEDGMHSWQPFCELLESITGDKYTGDWEIF